MFDVFKIRDDEITEVLKETAKSMAKNQKIMLNLDDIEKERGLTLDEKDTWCKASEEFDQAETKHILFLAKKTEVNALKTRFCNELLRVLNESKDLINIPSEVGTTCGQVQEAQYKIDFINELIESWGIIDWDKRSQEVQKDVQADLDRAFGSFDDNKPKGKSK